MNPTSNDAGVIYIPKKKVLAIDSVVVEQRSALATSPYSASPESGALVSSDGRLTRICELLCTAIVRSSLLDAFTCHAGTHGRLQPEPTTESKVLNFIALVGEVSPANLGIGLRMSRSSVTRILRQLVESGRITSSGRTRARAYRLSLSEIGRLRIGEN